MHIPLDIEDTITKARLQLRCYRTSTLVNFYLILIIDIAQSVITRNRVTTPHELILINILFVDKDRLLAVEFLWYHKQFLLVVVFFFLLTHKRHVLTPS